MHSLLDIRLLKNHKILIFSGHQNKNKTHFPPYRLTPSPYSIP